MNKKNIFKGLVVTAFAVVVVIIIVKVVSEYTPTSYESNMIAIILYEVLLNKGRIK